MNTTTPDIRHRPAWEINQKLRRAGTSQWAIGQAAGCSQGFVSKVILRRVKPSATVNRVWEEIARALRKGGIA